MTSPDTALDVPSVLGNSMVNSGVASLPIPLEIERVTPTFSSSSLLFVTGTVTPTDEEIAVALIAN